ncbi:hypothetical protein [Pedococcus sp. 5OH_020]|uniref:hypothetical protein n=1 Tax=Pedococcus sp. 5OH_020 TaxID=2989814 RepID=UPI0022EA0882|nr:hypothetical protein [Pedococcus sp. 5OH_020]
MLAGNTAQLQRWQSGLTELTSALEKLGMAPVRSYRQPVPGLASTGTEAGVLQFDPGLVNVAPPSLASLAATVARPSDCAQFTGSQPPARALDAEHWLAEYLGSIAKPGVFATGDTEVRAWAATADRAEQRRWAVAAYDALRTCSLENLEPPAHG